MMRCHRFQKRNFSTHLAALALLIFPSLFALSSDLHAQGARLPVAKADASRDAAVARTVRLNSLFLKLKTTDDGFVARSLVKMIWANWNQSGRGDVDALLMRGKIYVGKKQYDLALKQFTKVTQRAPNFAEGWNGRATVLFLMGRYEESLADIKKTLALEPRHFGALTGKGIIFFRQEKFKGALEALREALRHNPFITEQYTVLPLIRRKLGIMNL